MKAVLRPMLFLFLITGLFKLSAKAQCTASNIIFQNISSIGSTANSCTVKFDVSFNMETNTGNKYIFVHAWIQNDYPNYFDCINGAPKSKGTIAAPQGSDLAKSFINIGIDNNSDTPKVITTYPPDNSVPLENFGSIEVINLSDGTTTYILKDVVATIPVACGSQVVIIADLWSSQSATAQRAHCVNCGIKFSGGFMNLNGFVNCLSLNYGGTITNLTNTPITGYYRVYADINGDGYFTPAIDTLVMDTTYFNISASGSTAISGQLPSANINQDVFVLLTQTAGVASSASVVYSFMSSQCSPLPVTFKSLNAKRVNKNNVTITWETATEINNNGFSIQRNMGNAWENVAFITSQAQNGNSTTDLTYSFNDLNSHNGVSQYRIKQVDFDGKSKFSEIRSVRGENQQAKMIVYPNPSTDGRFTVVFEDKQGSRDVNLSDMSGRIITQWKAVSNNTIQVTGLKPGMYVLQVVVKETGYRTMEKIIITH